MRDTGQERNNDYKGAGGVVNVLGFPSQRAGQRKMDKRIICRRLRVAVAMRRKGYCRNQSF
jgi:hypothetical protein